MATVLRSVEPPSVQSKEPGSTDDLRQRRAGWLLITLLGPLLGFATLWFNSIPIGFLGLALTVATVSDLVYRKIYNWITYPTAFWAIVLNLTFSIVAGTTSLIEPTANAWMGLMGIQGCLMGGLCCFGVMLMVLLLARGGAGDLKLAVAIGFWLGLFQGLLVIIYCYILAGVFLICWLILSQGLFRTASLLLRGMGRLLLPSVIPPISEEEERLFNQPVPLSPFFAVSTLLVCAGY